MDLWMAVVVNPLETLYSMYVQECFYCTPIFGYIELYSHAIHTLYRHRSSDMTSMLVDARNAFNVHSKVTMYAFW
jgi:hypothetical protein